MTFRFRWLSTLAVAGLLAAASSAAQTSSSLCYLRGMFRDGKRIFFAAESAELKTIRRYELAATAKIRLYFPKPPFGQYVQRYVTVRRFADLFSGRDKKPPQPLTLKSPFRMTIRGYKITALEQRNL